MDEERLKKYLPLFLALDAIIVATFIYFVCIK